MWIKFGAVSVWMLWVACAAEEPPPAEPALPDLRPYADMGGHFELVDQRGELFSLTALSGRVTLLFFGCKLERIQ